MKVPRLLACSFAAESLTACAFLVESFNPTGFGQAIRGRRRNESPSTAHVDTGLRVRNVDLPEALVFYDVYKRGDWSNLLKQCHECDIPSIVIDSPHIRKDSLSSSDPSAETEWQSGTNAPTLRVDASNNPPNPRDLWESLQSLTVRPKPFGGSSGFAASQIREPPRPPLPARVVVLGATVDHSRAARYAGTRVISLDDGEDDSLADAVLGVEELQELWIEDLATPGSFWLNPPHPRDDYGNRVDPERMIVATASSLGRTDGAPRGAADAPGKSERDGEAPPSSPDDESHEEEELQRILADLSPL